MALAAETGLEGRFTQAHFAATGSPQFLRAFHALPHEEAVRRLAHRLANGA